MSLPPEEQARANFYALLSRLFHAAPDAGPLAGLRAELAGIGLARRNEVAEPEDHIAALCDVMRFLVTENDLADQQRFFGRWIQPIVEPLCNAIETNGQTIFYKHVARMTKAFFSLERSAFEML